MAHFSSRVEVRGDPTLAAQMQSDMNMGMHMGPSMGMNMNMGMPDAKMKFDVGDAKMKVKVGDTKMKVDMGMPDVSFKVNQPSVNVSMGVPSIGVSVPNASLSFNVGVPQPVVTQHVVTTHHVQSAPPQFGYDFSIVVSEPRRVGEPPEERTEYCFTLTTNLREWGVHPALRISKRYKLVKRMYDRLEKKYGSKLPPFPAKNNFGRFKTAVINDRLQKFQIIMGTIAADPQMRVEQAVKDFFFKQENF
jgi:hypothetical protein